MEELDYKMIGSPASSDQGKMVIKLKFPKLEKGIENGSKADEDAEGLKMNVRVCQECKKEFSSGKALGGHMRVHVIQAASTFKQNPSSNSSSKKVKKDVKAVKKQSAAVKKPLYLDSVNNEGKPMCSQCGKTFPSMKSLFGHMRCHPERVWRGILPPPNIGNGPNPASHHVVISGGSSSSNSLSVNNDEKLAAIDLTKFLRGWGVTEKRGRPSLKRSVISSDDENDEDEDGVLLEAVEDLMSLANCVTTFEGSDSSFVNSKDKKAKLKVFEPVKFELDDDDGDQSDHGYKMMSYSNAYKSNVYKMKKRKKMKLMMELELEGQVIVDSTTNIPDPGNLLVGDNECKYKCTTCNKCFNSHQALGGHRSSHNKSIKIHDQEDDDHYESSIKAVMDQKELAIAAAAHQFAAAAGGDHHHSVISSSVLLHQCKICDKVFPTGQALGGHKRCHWTGLTEPQAQAQAPSSQITSTGEGGGSQSGSGRKVFDFDLNEIPIPIPMEDQDGITIGLGNEYASSSYNSNMG